MVELKQYKRENLYKNQSQNYFVSLHLGFQVVVWELTNTPKIKMKMLWFYLIEESQQAFCMAELQPLLKLSEAKTKMPLEQVASLANSKYLKVDLVLGFEKGYVKFYDLSHHFQKLEAPEGLQPVANHLKFKFSQPKEGESIETNNLQVAQKNCGLLTFVKPIRLHDCDSIIFIQEVTSSQLKIGPKSKPNQYVLVGSINCIIYLINYNSSE